MPDEKRMKYFNGQFLKADDFSEEQTYHITRLERHNRLLHSPGIADGLAVTAEANASQVTVTQGTAIDGNGKPIVLASDRVVPINAANLRGQTVLIAISYAEQDDDANKQGDNPTRTKEVPKIEAVLESSNPSDINAVRLARISVSDQGTIANAGGIPDASVRRRAGQPPLADGAIAEIKLDPTVRAKLIGNTRINHSALTLDGGTNPHGTTAQNVGALPLGGGTLTGRLRVQTNATGSVGASGTPAISGLGSAFFLNTASNSYALVAKISDTADVLPSNNAIPAAAIAAISGFANTVGIYTTARTDGTALRVDGNSILNGNLQLNGTASRPGGGAWTDSSDRRLKQNIQPLQNVLSRLLRLQGVSFEWKVPLNQGNRTGIQLGMIAQDVEPVFPDWVGTASNGDKTLTFRGFEALTVEAFRELKAENDQLKAICRSLETRLASLEAHSRRTIVPVG